MTYRLGRISLEFILLCHAATRAMKTGRFPTNDDPVEHDECAAIAGRFEGDVIASPALAARQTAEWIAPAHDIDPLFADMDYGRWRGQSVRAIGESERDAISAWLTDPHARPHGGESIAMLSARVMNALEGYAMNGKAERRIVVTHAIVIKAAMAHALGKPLESVFELDIAPLTPIGLTRQENSVWTLVR